MWEIVQEKAENLLAWGFYILLYLLLSEERKNQDYSLEMWLTCAVWQGSRPCSIGCALSYRWSRKYISFHAWINYWIGEGSSINTKYFSVSSCSWITTLHSYKGKCGIFSKCSKDDFWNGKSWSRNNPSSTSVTW